MIVTDPRFIGLQRLFWFEQIVGKDIARFRFAHGGADAAGHIEAIANGDVIPIGIILCFGQQVFDSLQTRVFAADLRDAQAGDAAKRGLCC